VHLAERYDLAIMSTKGISNTSARRLVDEMCGDRDLKLLALHDFDKSGLSIFATLREDTRRYTFTNDVEVIDLDLRLADVRQLRLQPESTFDKGSGQPAKEFASERRAAGRDFCFFSALFPVVLIILVL
jgi:hypothetical protein